MKQYMAKTSRALDDLFFSFILGGGLLIGTREAEMVKCKELRESERKGERERERERAAVPTEMVQS